MSRELKLTMQPRPGIALELHDPDTDVVGLVTDENSVVVYEMNGGGTLMDEVRGFANAQMAIGFAVLRTIEEVKLFEEIYGVNNGNHPGR